MALIIGLIPALAWGLIPLFVRKAGGQPVNQILGTTLGAFLLGAVVFLVRRPALDGTVFLYCFLSGACWAFGQMLQYTAYTQIGVSRTMPITASLQLLATSLMGVLLLGEWAGLRAKLIGFGAIALIIIGAAVTTWQEKKAAGAGQGSLPKAVLLLAVSALGYAGYSGFPRLVSADGWTEFFPQTTGMLAMALLFSLFITKGRALAQKTSYANMLSGLVFAVGALAYLISTALNGVAVGFALSQMNVVISTWGSILFLGEEKTKKERIAVAIGLALVIAGGIASTFA